jgi:hypothetical protein
MRLRSAQLQQNVTMMPYWWGRRDQAITFSLRRRPAAIPRSDLGRHVPAATRHGSGCRQVSTGLWRAPRRQHHRIGRGVSGMTGSPRCAGRHGQRGGASDLGQPECRSGAEMLRGCRRAQRADYGHGRPHTVEQPDHRADADAAVLGCLGCQGVAHRPKDRPRRGRDAQHGHDGQRCRADRRRAEGGNDSEQPQQITGSFSARRPTEAVSVLPTTNSIPETA